MINKRIDYTKIDSREGELASPESHQSPGEEIQEDTTYLNNLYRKMILAQILKEIRPRTCKGRQDPSSKINPAALEFALARGSDIPILCGPLH